MSDTNISNNDLSNIPNPFSPPQDVRPAEQLSNAMPPVQLVSGQQANAMASVQQSVVQQAEQQGKFNLAQARTYLTGGKFDEDVFNFRAGSNLKTGYKTLDRIQPFYPGLYCLGAIPSLGKTTFAAQLADQIAASGNYALFFSLEMTEFELFGKSLARGFYTTHMRDKRNSGVGFSTYPIPSSTAIRNGSARSAYPNEWAEQVDAYAQSVGDRVCVITGDSPVTVEDIVNITKGFINQTGEKPVVIVDYLQIVAPNPAIDHNADTKSNVDRTVGRLKSLAKDFKLPVLAISSLNRQNYQQAIDFESFKESGGIEYTADVVWGLQLSILHDPAFIKAKNVTVQRDMIREAKSAPFRSVELVWLKNRNGPIGDAVQFEYHQRHDFFCPPFSPGDPDTFI